MIILPLILSLTLAQQINNVPNCFRETAVFGNSQGLQLKSDYEDYLSKDIYNTSMVVKQLHVCGNRVDAENSIRYMSFQGIHLFLGEPSYETLLPLN